MRNYLLIAICFLSFSVFGQNMVDEVYVQDLENLENEYLENNDDPKAKLLISKLKNSQSAFKSLLADNGIGWDLNTFKQKRKELQAIEQAIPMYKVFNTDLKNKLTYFWSKEGFSEIIKEAYPSLAMKIERQFIGN